MSDERIALEPAFGAKNRVFLNEHRFNIKKAVIKFFIKNLMCVKKIYVLTQSEDAQSKDAFAGNYGRPRTPRDYGGRKGRVIKRIVKRIDGSEDVTIHSRRSASIISNVTDYFDQCAKIDDPESPATVSPQASSIIEVCRILS